MAEPVTTREQRLEAAIRQIAEHGEHAESEWGEPQNMVPQFCRAVLDGYEGTLEQFQYGPSAGKSDREPPHAD